MGEESPKALRMGVSAAITGAEFSLIASENFLLLFRNSLLR